MNKRPQQKSKKQNPNKQFKISSSHINRVAPALRQPVLLDRDPSALRFHLLRCSAIPLCISRLTSVGCVSPGFQISWFQGGLVQPMRSSCVWLESGKWGEDMGILLSFFLGKHLIGDCFFSVVPWYLWFCWPLGSHSTTISFCSLDQGFLIFLVSKSPHCPHFASLISHHLYNDSSTSYSLWCKASINKIVWYWFMNR